MASRGEDGPPPWTEGACGVWCPESRAALPAPPATLPGRDPRTVRRAPRVAVWTAGAATFLIPPRAAARPVADRRGHTRHGRAPRMGRARRGRRRAGRRPGGRDSAPAAAAAHATATRAAGRGQPVVAGAPSTATPAPRRWRLSRLARGSLDVWPPPGRLARRPRPPPAAPLCRCRCRPSRLAAASTSPLRTRHSRLLYPTPRTGWGGGGRAAPSLVLALLSVCAPVVRPPVGRPAAARVGGPTR